MAVKLYQGRTSMAIQDSGVGANSLDITERCFVTKAAGTVSKATASTRISGVSDTIKTYASDNATVAQERVTFTSKDTKEFYEVDVTGGTITIADEGKFYNLSDEVTVDGTTESTTPFYVNTSDAGAAVDPVISMQLELVKFISATKCVFKIVNL